MKPYLEFVYHIHTPNFIHFITRRHNIKLHAKHKWIHGSVCSNVFFFFFKAIIVMRKVRQEWHESAFNELNITWKNPHSFHLIKYENNGGCTMRIKMRLKIKYILAMWCALSVDFTLLQKIRTLIQIFPWTFWRVSNTFFKYAISVIIHHIPAYIWCFLSFEKFSPCFDSKTLAFYMKSTKVY